MKDKIGYFGQYGGAFVPEVLHATLEQLEREFERAKSDSHFWNDYVSLMRNYSCRPTPLTFAENLTRILGGARIFLKREDLNHTGSHKANNVMGQGLLVRRMGKKRVIAETGAGQHGVATATMAARLGLECTIYMGAVDVARQRPNVFWMEQLGATVVSVKDGTQTLKDAMNAAFRDWAGSMDATHYVIGTACGPHPFPTMVAWFQSIIGKEVRHQLEAQTGHPLPHSVYACVGGGSNALGLFSEYIEDLSVRLVGVEAGGKGISTGLHASRLSNDGARVGIAQGYKTYFLQDSYGQMQHTHSISAGLDYVGVSPILSHLHDTRRVEFYNATDEEVVAAVRTLVRYEGIIPALETAHGVVQALKEASTMKQSDSIVVNISGRGDKDIFTIAEAFDDPSWKEFIKQKGGAYGAG
jgi:tryptophan synthase beta chain